MIISGTQRRQSLAAFLRRRRAALRPESLGIPAIGRRRTPGLRREEIAQAAGMSPTWYTFLEQGREVSVSSQTLGRLASALQLSDAERAFFFGLAEKHDPRFPPPGEAKSAPAALIESVRAISVPAYVLDRTYTACAWNEAAAALFVGWLDAAGDKDGDKNLLRFVFLNPAAKTLIADWETRAARLIAEFRADAARSLEDTDIADLIAELRRRSVLFDAMWQRQSVAAREGGERRFHHPRDGERAFEQLTFAYAPRPEFKLVMLVGV